MKKMFFLNRSENITCENYATQPGYFSTGRHTGRCSTGPSYSDPFLIFFPGRFEVSCRQNNSASKSKVTRSCPNYNKKFPNFHSLRQYNFQVKVLKNQAEPEVNMPTQKIEGFVDKYTQVKLGSPEDFPFTLQLKRVRLKVFI